MFARYFIELPLPPDRVAHLLTRDPGMWLPGLAERANRRGDDLLAEVGFGERIRIARPVAISVGEPVYAGTKTVLPLRWTPSRGAGLFPSLEADLEIASLAGGTQLAMSARYSPPLRAVGKVVDRVVLYRVAEATIKNFLDRVGTALMATDAAASSEDIRV